MKFHGGSVKNLKLLFAGVAGVATVASATAAKAAPPAATPMPAFSWTGCHVGIHGGGGWARQTTNARSSGAIIRVSDVHSDGALFGGQIGCDKEFANGWIVGIEGDGAATNIKGMGADPFNLTNSAFSVDATARWLASATGRVGYGGLHPQLQVYAKGGAAWAGERYTINSGVTELNGTFDKTLSGWTAGGGIAWAFTRNCSFFVEYNHYDFRGNFSNSFDFGVPFGTSIINIGAPRIETVKVGLNYRFGGPL
jgi:outer membrane immunogenic protein